MSGSFRARQDGGPDPGPWWKRFFSRKLQVAMDGAALTAAFVAAYLLRFEFAVPPEYVRKLVVQLPFVVAIQLGALFFCGIYQLIWRYVGLAELKRFVSAATLGALPALLARAVLPESLAPFRVPVSVSLLTAFLGLGGVLGLRVARRLFYEHFERQATVRARGQRSRKPVLLVGAGRAGVLAARELLSRGDLDVEVRGFVDDDPEKAGSVIHDVHVLGTSAEIPRLVRELEIDHVVITIAKGTRSEILRIVEICDQVPVKVRIIPGLYDILQGRVALDPIRDIEIEDLLGRDPVRLDESGMSDLIRGRVVMVTGAGGSIGSELVRQVARFEPKRILMVDRSEPFLFLIEQEMRRRSSSVEVVPLIGDVGDEERMSAILRVHAAEVVLHAAAHKHVPMMELNPGEAVKNNVAGTLTLGRVAGRHGCKVFVLISTDKAVNPTSVMGATKRVAELVIQGLQEEFPTKYLAVRFGNVLGSTGSVIPIFKEQIRRGGPVTVTHRDMQRYFMTIPEAAQLVLQAAALGEGGEIFILDMGEPVRICDIARDMIRLSGFRPGDDIQIEFTGLRPGEKLFEELGTSEDQVAKTRHPKVFIGRIPRMESSMITRGVRKLLELARNGDEPALRRALAALVPEGTLSEAAPNALKAGEAVGCPAKNDLETVAS